MARFLTIFPKIVKENKIANAKKVKVTEDKRIKEYLKRLKEKEKEAKKEAKKKKTRS